MKITGDGLVKAWRHLLKCCRKFDGQHQVSPVRARWQIEYVTEQPNIIEIYWGIVWLYWPGSIECETGMGAPDLGRGISIRPMLNHSNKPWVSQPYHCLLNATVLHVHATWMPHQRLWWMPKVSFHGHCSSFALYAYAQFPAFIAVWCHSDASHWQPLLSISIFRSIFQ